MTHVAEENRSRYQLVTAHAPRNPACSCHNGSEMPFSTLSTPSANPENVKVWNEPKLFSDKYGDDCALALNLKARSLTPSNGRDSFRLGSA